MSSFISDIRERNLLVSLCANYLTSMILHPMLQICEHSLLPINNPFEFYLNHIDKALFVPCDFVLPKQI